MWFVDRAEISVKGGDGGRGCSAYAQPPYTRYPYPDGGDGGHGGDVIVRVDPNLSTLLDFHFRHEFSAGRGGHGGGNGKTGHQGEDCIIRVPPGTMIRTEDDTVRRDLTQDGEELVIASGGRGGLGNGSRMAKLNRSPHAKKQMTTVPEATPGQPGNARRLILELKLIADVGIIGFPNAGKSSLLARLSTARPKVGSYPFTTRYPVLGVVQAGPGRSFVACDIPGLIEGAHEGKGLGFQFLRHIERTRVLVHLIDMAAVDGRDPVASFHQVNAELSAYDGSLESRPQVIAANKMDVPEAKERLARFRDAVPQPVWPISCATGEGIPALLKAVWRLLQEAPPCP